MRALALALAVLVIGCGATQAASRKVPLPCQTIDLEFSHIGNRAGVLCRDMSVRLIDIPSGRVIRAITLKNPPVNGAMSSDGKLTALAARGGEIFVFTTAGSAAPVQWNAGGSAGVMRFLPGNLLVVDDTVWSTTPPHRVATLATDFDFINDIAVSAQGDRLATAGADTTVRVYDTRSWKPLFVNRDMLLEPFAVAFTPDDSNLVVGGADNRLTVLDALSGKRLQALPPFRAGTVRTLNALADKNWIAVELSNPATANRIGWQFVNLKTGQRKPICSNGARVRFAGTQAWCFDAHGQTLEPASEPPL